MRDIAWVGQTSVTGVAMYLNFRRFEVLTTESLHEAPTVLVLFARPSLEIVANASGRHRRRGQSIVDV